MRKIEYIGAPNPNQLEAYLPKLPQWPDVDRVTSSAGVISPGTYDDGQFLTMAPGLRALALAPDTDHDLIYIQFRGESDWKLLAPGVVLFPEAGVTDRFKVKPAMQMPSTRLYDARQKRADKSAAPLPTTPPYGIAAPTGLAVANNWTVVNPTVDGVNGNKLINNTAVARVVYKWTGTGWKFFENVASNGFATVAGADGAIGPLANTNRASDFSPDGIWSFADYMEAGQILKSALVGPPATSAAGVAYVSAASFDNHGNAGDPTNPTTKLFNTTFTSSAPPWGPLSSLWLAKLSVEMFIDECPPPGYRPCVAPARVITLPQFTAPAGVNLTPLLTVPAVNVERAQWSVITDSTQGANVSIALGSPLPSEGIDAPAQTQTVANNLGAVAGVGGAAFRGESDHDLVQLLAGVPNGQATAGVILAGSRLVLVRRFIG